ncbi:unnamed protein product [Clavelina lepadiformis]|uniref:Uncharacterized protein n=1 Tax=Clavelina lepadiformis TaxID=159417 RepID=A0ABP0H002_CLALP
MPRFPPLYDGDLEFDPPWPESSEIHKNATGTKKCDKTPKTYKMLYEQVMRRNSSFLVNT